MAKRRMFSLDVVNTDRFLDMSTSARLLYFDLGMRADDEGFVGSPNMIIRSTGSSRESMDELIKQGYVIPFQSGVIVMPHWKMNNYLQSDRITPTIYINEKEQLSIGENKVYSRENDPMDTTCIQDVSNLCIQNVSKMDTQYSIDKNSIDKKYIVGKPNVTDSKKKKTNKSPFEKLEQEQQDELKRIIEHLNNRIGTKYSAQTKDTVTKYTKLKSLGYTEEDFKTVIEKKAKEWIGTEYAKYLRPQTLFQESKFDGYLNQPEANKQQKNPYSGFEVIN
ncbi:conserved phage C-terminal domain-containing protein [Dubosiella newyorkensis]|uniref:conserved phage C-terminal domain-containing protein n=1 Tax=Dubosiella newyorkensis TaxID=1862672 RepID=UPI0024BA5379|nr:conserved phage C-terminal domain-containing protein [Dubosiella newyorkensis]